ncbi:MAG: DNA double-strand break repair nuclease NurA, partial [Candidatus Babeliales bacterium]
MSNNSRAMMLDRSKVMRELQQLADKLFPDYSPAYDLAQKSWYRLVADPTFIYKVREFQNPPWPVPTWIDSINKVIPVAKNINDYTIVSVDGSQIYPDRHNNISCFLINIGSVILPYGIQQGGIAFNSVPYIFTHDDEDIVDLGISPEVVDCRRQELELKVGLELSKEIRKNENSLLLFDGSLIFWHLASKEAEIRDAFLQSYYALLYQLYEEKIPIASYISSPKSKELLNLIRLE